MFQSEVLFLNNGRRDMGRERLGMARGWNVIAHVFLEFSLRGRRGAFCIKVRF